jgi:hypothetical protein
MPTPTRFRAYDTNGNVFHEGEVDKDGKVKFTAEGDVAHIAFYSGDIENEVCEGAVDIKESGMVSVDAVCPEPDVVLAPPIVVEGTGTAGGVGDVVTILAKVVGSADSAPSRGTSSDAGE